jgi:hypothetical protein
MRPEQRCGSKRPVEAAPHGTEESGDGRAPGFAEETLRQSFCRKHGGRGGGAGQAHSVRWPAGVGKCH